MRRWFIAGALASPTVAILVVLYYLPTKLTKPTSPVEFWVLVQGMSAVFVLSVTLGLGLVGLYGLRSLRLTRTDMVTRATRDSRSLAVSKAEQFSKLIHVQGKAIHEELQTAGIVPFTETLAGGAPIFDPSMYPKAKAWWTKIPAGTKTNIIHYLNEFEAWAMCFNEALADTDVVFGPCAPTFCSIILQYSPWIVVCRKEQFDGYYPNIQKLFQAWRAQLDAKETGTKTDAALRAARAVQERLTQHRVPDPLGTKVEM